MRLSAAKDNVADLGRIERRGLTQHIANAMRGQVVGARDVERSAMRLGEGGAGTGDDNGFSHSITSLRRRRWRRFHLRACQNRQRFCLLRRVALTTAPASKAFRAVSRIPEY